MRSNFPILAKPFHSVAAEREIDGAPEKPDVRMPMGLFVGTHWTIFLWFILLPAACTAFTNLRFEGSGFNYNLRNAYKLAHSSGNCLAHQCGVQNAMTGPDTSLAGGAVAALILLTLNFLLAELSGLNRRFRKMVQGSPTLLVHNGECITPHLAKEHVSMDELNRALREHGVACISDAALAVLEVDGSISVLKYDDVPDQVRPQKRLRFLHRH